MHTHLCGDSCTHICMDTHAHTFDGHTCAHICMDTHAHIVFSDGDVQGLVNCTTATACIRVFLICPAVGVKQ